MAETTEQPPPGLTREAEEAGFYHEAALNAAWTGARLALGGLSFGFGAFVFAFFYLKSLNSHHLWYPSGFKAPQAWVGIVVMLLVVVSALLQYLVLQRIKAGHKGVWLNGAWVSLVLGLAAVGIEIWQLTALPFFPGAAGFASVHPSMGATGAVLLVSRSSAQRPYVSVAKAEGGNGSGGSSGHQASPRDPAGTPGKRRNRSCMPQKQPPARIAVS